MAATKSAVLMLMIASLASGILAVMLALFIGSSQMLIISAPGFVIGAFFAFKYFTFDKSRRKEEEHRKSRNRNRH